MSYLDLTDFAPGRLSLAMMERIPDVGRQAERRASELARLDGRGLDIGELARGVLLDKIRPEDQLALAARLYGDKK